MQELNCKFFGGNIGVNIHDLRVSNGFLDMTPEVQATKEKVGQFDVIKIKSFCVPEDTIEKVKTTHQMEKNICKLYIC